MTLHSLPRATRGTPAHQPGGSAVAVAAKLVPTAIGSDTAGSIRGPAGNCGAVGLKPSFGLVSRHGTVPLASSLDHPGPITRTGRDTALVRDAIAGDDARDPDSLQDGGRGAPIVDARAALAPLRVGYVQSFHLHDLKCDPEIVAALDRTATALAAEGAEVSTVELPPTQLFASVSRTIMLAEGYARHGYLFRDRPSDLAVRTRNASCPAPSFARINLHEPTRSNEI